MKNFSQALLQKTTAFDASIKAIALKTMYSTSNFKTWKENIFAEVKEKIIELKEKMRPKQTKPVLSHPNLKKQLEELHQKFAIIIIVKAWNNFVFICRKHHISKQLAEVSPDENKNLTWTYSQTQKSKEKLIETKIEYCKKHDFKITEQDRTLAINHWLLKLHMTPIGTRFVVLLKNCSVSLSKPLSDVISNVFKMIFNHVESFQRKILFYTCFRKFWVAGNSFRIATKLNK